MTTQLELDLAPLRARRPERSFRAWIRGLRPFDRRSIRDPRERDAYWATVQRRLAESDAAFILGRLATERPRPSAVGEHPGAAIATVGEER